MWLASGMIVGGALGNLTDRIRAGAVTDFIKLPHGPRSTSRTRRSRSGCSS